MNILAIRRFFLTLICLVIFVAACSSNSESSSDKSAALSCLDDLNSPLESGEIVNVGLIVGTRTDKLANEAALAEVRKRAILSAEAAALDTYWQPLADAWALNEAFIFAIIRGGPTDDGAGNATTGSPEYESFLSNVNLDFASISKDTYCRIAFSKLGVKINYDSKSD
jgi:hypothetical protein